MIQSIHMVTTGNSGDDRVVQFGRAGDTAYYFWKFIRLGCLRKSWPWTRPGWYTDTRHWTRPGWYTKTRHWTSRLIYRHETLDASRLIYRYWTRPGWYILWTRPGWYADPGLVQVDIMVSSVRYMITIQNPVASRLMLKIYSPELAGYIPGSWNFTSSLTIIW